MIRHPLMSIATVVLGLASLTPVASAQDKPATKDAATAEQGSYRYFVSPDAPAVDARAYAAAAAQSAGAQAQYSLAQSAVNTIPVMLRSNFELSPEYRSAVTTLKQAQDAYEAARKKVLAGLALTDADYKAALVEIAALDKVLDAGKLTDADRQSLAERKLAYAAIATKIESEALESDTATKEARSKMLAAGSKVTDMRVANELAIRNDPSFQSARNNLQQAWVDSAAADAYFLAMDAAYGEILDAYYYKEFQRRYHHYDYGSYYYPHWR